MKKRTDTVAIAVTLFTQTEVLNGSVYHLDVGRLSDVLNDVSVEQGWRDNRFLELGNVTVCNANGHKDSVPIICINKATIHMALLADGNLARGAGSRTGPKSFPFVLKSPVRVKLRTLYYTLIGNMHCTSWQEVRDVLDEEPMFLPLTDVSICPLGDDIGLTAPFVAVNKEQLLSLEQHELSPASLRLFKAFRKIIDLKFGID